MSSPNHPHPGGMASFKAFVFGSGLTVVQIMLPSVAGSVMDSLVYGVIGLVTLTVVSKIRESQQRSNDNVSIGSETQMYMYQVQLRAFFLGWGLSCGIRCVTSGYSVPLGLYISLLSLFHYSEFLVTSVISPETCTLDSFLLNHSKEYGIAAFASVLEFFIEFYFVPSLKNMTWVTVIGIAMCLTGEFVRKWAMLTASRNFTHLVRDTKEEGQYLVTSGPYSVFRHPGYAGWFWFSVGTQLVQVNPFCAVAYCLAVYKFFKGRIYYEEICLISFFGLDYIEYQKSVPRTGVPFVKGYIPVQETAYPPINSHIDDEDSSVESSSIDDNFQKLGHDQLEDHD